MNRILAKGRAAAFLAIAALVGITLVTATGPARAADPDRYLSESDRRDDELERRIESALEGLEGLESLDGLGADLENLSEEIGEMIEDALRDGAVVIDGEWPDRVYVRGNRAELEFDAERFARQMERMSREIERSIRLNFEAQPWGDSRVRVWRMEEDRDREDIEAEMRDLQREMRRLQRELDELEAEGDI